MGGKEFHQLIKGILDYIFSFNEIREIVCRYDNLIEGITSFLERIFLFRRNLEFDENLGLQYVKGFFVKNKKYLKKYEDVEEQFEAFWDICIEYGDKLTNKIRSISNFNDKDYSDLRFKSDIGKYYYLPFVIEKGTTKKDKKKLLKKFSIVFYEDRKPNITPWKIS